MQNSEPYRNLIAESYQANGLNSIPLEELFEHVSATEKALMPDVLEKPMAVDIDKYIEINAYLTVQEWDMYLNNVDGVLAIVDTYFPKSKTEYAPLREGAILLSRNLSSDPVKYRYAKFYLVACWLLAQFYSSFFVNPCICYKDYSTRQDVIHASTLSDFLKSTPDALDIVTFDYFACMIAMPRETFVPKAREIMNKYGFGDKYNSDEARNNDFKKVVDELAAIYKVPDYAVLMHLQTVGLYIDNSN